MDPFLGVRSGGWFFAGLIFGIFGLIGAALAQAKSPEKFERAPWTCTCGRRNGGYDDRCPKCGNLAPFLKPAEKKYPQCAEMVKAEAKVCRFCQYKFEDVPTA